MTGVQTCALPICFCGQIFSEAPDKELALLCIKAYNDWMVDEWCGESDGHMIPLIIVPLWDAQLAADEVRRNAARGAHAVCFSEIPPKLGLPSIHSGAWDPFFAACQETETVVCMHIGSSSQMPSTWTRFNVASSSDPGMLRFIQAVLSKDKYEILAAQDGLEAVEIVLREHPDLILLDVMMPGMDGGTLARLIRVERPEIRIIVISGYSEEVARGDIVDTADFHFLPKPFSLGQLASKVKDVLSETKT